MIKGDTQSGKTFLVDALACAWADELGYPKPMPVFKLSGSSGVTDYDLFGQPSALGNQIVQMPGLVDMAARAGGILYLDEVNAMGERVTSSLHPVADSTHMFINRSKPVVSDGTVMPDLVSTNLDLWIIGTFNEGYRGMSDMNEAFLNRFRHIPWDYSEEVEKRLVKSAAIRLLGEGLRLARTKGHLRTPVGTSALERLESDVQEFGVAIALNIFGGLFKQHERAQVETVIEDRSIIIALNEELKQAEANAAPF
jgi:MoxR-like ATPase